ncbi:DNA internalization-related competence protein ComEC/Rec2 [Amphritea sp.]|uniref:DNA internalization-related competence protein ComEC/Rec2 n=1 Tax=Amphritea sp. TaxID=1872502 RepID=UPI003A93251A
MIGIALGVLLVAWLPQLSSYWVLAVLSMVLLVLCLPVCQVVLRPWLFKTRRHYWDQLVVRWRVQIAGVLLGVIYASGWGYYNLSQRMPLDMPAQTITVEGLVSHLPETMPGMSRFRFDVESYSPALVDTDLKHLLLSWYNPDQEIMPGQRWSLVVRLKPPRGLMNPGSSDYETRLFAEQVNARGYVKRAQLLNSANETGQYPLEKWRYQFAQWLTQLSLAAPTDATIRALVLGDKQGLQDEQWQMLRQTGTVHLVVISGLHIGIACLLGYGLGWFLQLSLGRLMPASTDIRAYRIIPALLLASGYALLAGFSIPTQRALIMSLAMLLPALFNRHVGIWQRYRLALVMVLLLQPLSFYQPGFWLSFAAVAALFLTVNQEGSRRPIATILATQWAVFLGLLPLLLLWLGQVALLAPLVNLLAIPLLTFVLLPGVMLGLLLSLGDSSVGVVLLDGLINYFWQLLAFCSPAGGMLSGHPAMFAVMLGVMAAALLILPRWLGVRSFGVFLLLGLIFPAKPSLRSGDFRATVVDVGQGLSVLIETETKTLVFDTGAAYNGRSIARFTLLPLLASRQIERIDRVVLSHKDNDHAGGYSALSESVAIGDIQTGSPKLLRRLSAQRCVSDDSWQWDGIRFRYIQPARLAVVNENNRSCVLLVESEHCSLVIPGDIESSIESQILSRYPDLDANWLVAAHHGSRFSSSPEWLARLDPQQVLFSAGFDNPYGHPAEAVTQRLDDLQLPSLNTAEKGALILESNANGCLTHAYREQKKRYWTAG